MTVPIDPYARLRALGITLPAPPIPIANYVSAKRVGDLLFLSGQGPRDPSGVLMTGKVGQDFTTAQACQHARFVGVALLGVIQATLGSLNRVASVVKLLGMVNATADFAQHPQVINGCSDLFVAVFGDEIGRHARSAVGMASLPGKISVEIEAIVAIRD